MTRLRGESHPKSKLTAEQVLEIRDLYSKGFSTNVISRNYKVSTWNVEEIVKRKSPRYRKITCNNEAKHSFMSNSEVTHARPGVHTQQWWHK